MGRSQTSIHTHSHTSSVKVHYRCEPARLPKRVPGSGGRGGSRQRVVLFALMQVGKKQTNDRETRRSVQEIRTLVAQSWQNGELRENSFALAIG